jgi:hypothetical protein
MTTSVCDYRFSDEELSDWMVANPICQRITGENRQYLTALYLDNWDDTNVHVFFRTPTTFCSLLKDLVAAVKVYVDELAASSFDELRELFPYANLVNLRRMIAEPTFTPSEEEDEEGDDREEEEEEEPEVICRNWAKSGMCQHGSSCRFAHPKKAQVVAVVAVVAVVDAGAAEGGSMSWEYDI